MTRKAFSCFPGNARGLQPIRAVDAEAFVRYYAPMPATTYKTWDDVPEEIRASLAMQAIEETETELEGRQFLANKLGIPIETIPPGEMVTK